MQNKKEILILNKSIRIKLLPWKDYETDVSSVSNSSERISLPYRYGTTTGSYVEWHLVLVYIRNYCGIFHKPTTLNPGSHCFPLFSSNRRAGEGKEREREPEFHHRLKRKQTIQNNKGVSLMNTKRQWKKFAIWVYFVSTEHDRITVKMDETRCLKHDKKKQKNALTVNHLWPYSNLGPRVSPLGQKRDPGGEVDSSLASAGVFYHEKKIIIIIIIIIIIM